MTPYSRSTGDNRGVNNIVPKKGSGVWGSSGLGEVTNWDCDFFVDDGNISRS